MCGQRDPRLANPHCLRPTLEIGIDRLDERGLNYGATRQIVLAATSPSTMDRCQKMLSASRYVGGANNSALSSFALAARRIWFARRRDDASRAGCLATAASASGHGVDAEKMANKMSIQVTQVFACGMLINGTARRELKACVEDALSRPFRGDST